MATGAIFTLVVNDGRQDNLLNASDLLKDRLSALARLNIDTPKYVPSLTDIEKTHVLFFNAHFKPFVAIGFEYQKLQPSSTATLNSTVSFSISQFGDFFHDMVLHVRLGPVTAATAANTWRWVSYPGERLMEKTKFSVNGTVLDEYSPQDYKFYREFRLCEDKRVGYDRCMGQQALLPAQVVPVSGLELNNGPNPVGSFGASTVTGVDESTGLWVQVSDGYQTVKTGTAHMDQSSANGHQRTDVLELTVPLIFWFNELPQLAIPAISIPYGTRFVEFEVTTLANLARGVVVTGNGGVGNSVAATLSVTGADFSVCNLYVNNIFVNPEIHDIFVKRIGFNLIRVHRKQVNRVTSCALGEQLMNNFKWPIETIYFGFRDVTRNQVTTGALSYLDHWHSFGQAFSVVNSTTLASTHVLTYQYNKLLPVVQSITVSAQGINVYADIPALLFNQYVPWAYGAKINTPKDPGVYCVTFNLYPGVYQPSGHINVSRAREFYIKYDNTIPTTARNLGVAITSADLMATARAINFLLISDGSAVLRYST